MLTFEMARYRVTMKDGTIRFVRAANTDALIRFLGEWEHVKATVAQIDLQRTVDGQPVDHFRETQILAGNGHPLAVADDDGHYGCMMSTIHGDGDPH